MMRRRSLGMRGEIQETDPRFLVADKPMGVVRRTSHGNTFTLDGANPDSKGKLIKVENDKSLPWTVAVNSKLPAGATLGTSRVGAMARGTFGNGGVTENVEFDCTPDSVVFLPGAFVDLDVTWSPRIELQAANAFVERVTGTLPQFLEVHAVASLGDTPARGTATRTFFVDSAVGAGGPWRLPIPPFADKLHVYCQAEADYANITSLVFAMGSGIVTYTGAQLLAFKNAGVGIPVPGNALTANLTLGAALGNMYLTYDLSL